MSDCKCINNMTVELIDHCLSNMRKGKACGPDNLCAEHLLYAHPSLVMHLKRLYVLILKHGFVPNSFGCGVSIPLVKDKTGNLNDVDNYRGITLSPIISKLFGMTVLEICNDVLMTDSLQFGFKTGTSCANAIFTLKTTVQHFIDNGSSVLYHLWTLARPLIEFIISNCITLFCLLVFLL